MLINYNYHWILKAINTFSSLKVEKSIYQPEALKLSEQCFMNKASLHYDHDK